MTTYIFRDRPTSIPEHLQHRYGVMEHVRLVQSSPEETARRVSEAGEYPYLTGMYDDLGGGDDQFPNDEIRIAFWTRWASEFIDGLRELDHNVKVLCVEHPRTMGGRRHHPEWQACFGRVEWDFEDQVEGAVYTQFGVPGTGGTFYVLPMPSWMTGEPDDKDAIWCNLPGQNGFGGKWTDQPTFALAIAWATAHDINNVICWSDPRHPSSDSTMDRAFETIAFLDPPPIRTPVENMPDQQWRADDTMDTFTARLAQIARDAKGGG